MISSSERRSRTCCVGRASHRRSACRPGGVGASSTRCGPVALGLLPRVKRSTKGEGHERRYFYGSVWAVCIAQPVLWLLWRVLPQTRPFAALKLAVFLGILAWIGNLARRGLLPRTRPIVPGELAVSD